MSFFFYLAPKNSHFQFKEFRNRASVSSFKLFSRSRHYTMHYSTETHDISNTNPHNSGFFETLFIVKPVPVIYRLKHIDNRSLSAVGSPKERNRMHHPRQPPRPTGDPTHHHSAPPFHVRNSRLQLASFQTPFQYPPTTIH